MLNMDRSFPDDWLYDRVRLQSTETLGTMKKHMNDLLMFTLISVVWGKKEEILTHTVLACP